MSNTLRGLLLLLVPAIAFAQGNTAELLDQATRYHEALDVERELVILRQVISPNSPFVVTHDQRVTAYKYLGAALVVLGQPDSGVVYFRAALERDPFVDLEPQKFTPAELAAFSRAKQLTFGLGIRPIPVDTIDPRTERFAFTVVSTHDAQLQVELRHAGAPAGLTLYTGITGGARELLWNGLLEDGHVAPSGRYEVVVLGVSRVQQRLDSTRAYFSIEQSHQALDDTLPDLRAEDLLPEREPAAAARRELLKGLGIAAGALLIPATLANDQLNDGGRTFAGGVAVTAVAFGVAGFLHKQQHREIPANIAQNTKRRAERASTNAAIVQSNRDRLAQSRLIIAPAAGVGP